MRRPHNSKESHSCFDVYLVYKWENFFALFKKHELSVQSKIRLEILDLQFKKKDLGPKMAHKGLQRYILATHEARDLEFIAADKFVDT